MTRKYFLMTFKYTLLLVFVLAGITTSAQEKVPAEMPDTNFHIYLLMGQSNMAGRGKVEGAFLERSHERVLVINKRKEIGKAACRGRVCQSEKIKEVGGA